ncbi:MAG TPA: acetoacetate decarboxylase family protein [Solirubrobacterales bacterium]|jgi:acetoacetate decarboxylase|nr:acetoacetate decarboxylase family protein [Solirubrobacterales bacterium]
MDKASFAASYSLPIGSGSMYGPPPYLYRGVEDCFIVYEAEAAGVEELLPPGLEIADEVPTCIAWCRWVPFSTFGAYHEAYVMIRARFEDQVYIYQPFIFVDNEIPLGAGREIWGYAKKLAVFERNWGGDGVPFGEQMVFTVERPKGNRILTATMVADRLADPGELEEVPVLSTRIIPNSEANRPPSVAELVRLDVPATLHTAPDGTPKLFAGRGSLTMDTVSSVDPWHLLAPRRIVACYFGVYDFDLPHGKVIHDYLDDEEMWN